MYELYRLFCCMEHMPYLDKTTQIDDIVCQITKIYKKNKIILAQIKYSFYICNYK